MQVLDQLFCLAHRSVHLQTKLPPWPSPSGRFRPALPSSSCNSMHPGRRGEETTLACSLPDLVRRGAAATPECSQVNLARYDTATAAATAGKNPVADHARRDARCRCSMSDSRPSSMTHPAWRSSRCSDSSTSLPASFGRGEVSATAFANRGAATAGLATSLRRARPSSRRV